MKQYFMQIPISEETLKDITCEIVESLPYSWPLWHNDAPEFEKYKDTDMFLCDKVFDIIINGGSVKVTDIEEDAEPKYELTLERLIKGIEKNAIERPWDSNLESMDGITADCILQYAIFDEVIFG